MSDCAWVLENVAVLVAGGLSPADRARLEEHAAACASCGRALSETREVEDTMNAALAALRPAPGLEDRMIRGLRAASARGSLFRGGLWRKLAPVAAVLVMGLLGLGITQTFFEEGGPLLASRGKALRAHQSRGLAFSGEYETSVDGTDWTSVGGVDIPSASAMAAEVRKSLEGDFGREVTLTPPQLSASSEDARNLEERKDKAAGKKNYFGIRDQGAMQPPAAAPMPEPLSDKSDAPGRFFPAEELIKLTEGAEKERKRDDRAQQAGRAGSARRPAPDANRANEAQDPQAAQRKIIRSGEIEFEIAAFDPAVDTITNIVAEEKGYVATVNSEKLANGKVRGTIVVRVPPDNLDRLIVKLRALGEIKSQRVGSQDVTKAYFDIESRLRAARTMEARLREIIETGKGEIKDLLEAEKQLGEVLTKIEQMEGELRYFNNLISLSTLTITLMEKDIRRTANAIETEKVQMGVETEDVEKAHRDALAAIADAKGRVTKSDLKRHESGQLASLVTCEVAPDAAGPLRDRLSQLGRVARLDVQRAQTTEGEPIPGTDLRVERKDTLFFLSIYNLTNVAPRETTETRIAATDVAASYRALHQEVVKIKGRFMAANLNETDRQNVMGYLDVEIVRDQQGAFLEALNAAGVVMSRQATQAQDSPNVTDRKSRYRITIVAASTVPPRESTTLAIEVGRVEPVIESLRTAVKEAKGREDGFTTSREPSGRVTSRLIVSVPLAAADAIRTQVKAAGHLRVDSSSRNDQVPDGSLATARIDVTASNVMPIVGDDESFGAHIRKGLGIAFTVLFWAVIMLIVGVCAVLPIALPIWGAAKLIARMRRRAAPAA